MFGLLYAAAIGNASAVTHCLDRSQKHGFLWGDVTRTCARGRTALHYAVLGGHDKLVDPLIEAGASVDAADKEGQTCIMLAVQKNSPKLLDMLIRRSAAVNLAPSRDRATALHMAASGGHEECIQLLLKAGSQVGAEDVIGNTPLLEACRSGHMGALNLLLQAGGKCNTGATHKLGNSPLHAAVEAGHVDIVALLLQNKAPINWATRDGSTPMHVCAAVRSSSSRQDDMRAIATLLLSNSKLDLHAVNRAGRTSVSIAHDAVIKHKMREALLGRKPPPPKTIETRTREKKPKASMLTTPHPFIPGHEWAGPTCADLPSTGCLQRRTDCAHACAPDVQGEEGAGDATIPAHTVVPPWALHGELEEFSMLTHRAPQIEHERAIWNARADRPKSAYAHRPHKELLPSDALWIDSSEPYLHQYPPRTAWGRYN